jgi:RNA binding exosome subunit
VHATEDQDKVLKAVENCFPSITLSEIRFSRNSLSGHYKNPITFFETRIKDRDLIKAIIKDLSTKIERKDKELLLSELNKFVDEDGSLYMRADKQSIYNNILCLCSADPIHIKMRLSISSKNPQDTASVYKELGLL